MFKKVKGTNQMRRIEIVKSVSDQRRQKAAKNVTPFPHVWHASWPTLAYQTGF